jgi:ribosomal protein L32
MIEALAGPQIRASNSRRAMRRLGGLVTISRMHLENPGLGLSCIRKLDLGSSSWKKNPRRY